MRIITKPKYRCEVCNKATQVGKRAKNKCLTCYNRSIHNTPKYKKRASKYYKERFKKLKANPIKYNAWKKKLREYYAERKSKH